ncbi:hypothetical protein SAY86_023155 [Trapa natans]|uniref:Uncharacterized protein n=1 Tax=Trapa natans TaxID=22666 RepID=A0AAN7LUL5_TRANT|nr:hypothetical protein SAY86_023155 [Trapa natans]
MTMYRCKLGGFLLLLLDEILYESSTFYRTAMESIAEIFRPHWEQPASPTQSTRVELSGGAGVPYAVPLELGLATQKAAGSWLPPHFPFASLAVEQRPRRLLDLDLNLPPPE